MTTLTPNGRVTALRHPLVRTYLRRLDRALLHLDKADANELREEIVAHLSDSLPPEASTEDVQAVLDRLGTPESLISPGPGAPRRVPAPRWLVRLLRRHWIAVSSIVVVVAAAITCGAIADTYWHAPPLTGGWMVAPVYLSDSMKSIDAGIAEQTLLRARPGERQGFEVGIENDTDRAQTVLGVQHPHRFLDGYDVQFGIHRGEHEFGPFYRSVTIPPHGLAVVRIRFVTMCLNGEGAGRIISTDRLQLRVRVGWYTRNEDVVLDSMTIGLLDVRDPCTHAQWQAEHHSIIGGL